MRILFRDATHPARVAKTLKTHLETEGLTVGLRKAEQIVARMFGYKGWHELRAVSGREPASPLDHEVPVAEQHERREQYVGTLTAHGLDRAAAERVVDAVRPNGRRGGGKAPRAMRLPPFDPQAFGHFQEYLEAWREPLLRKHAFFSRSLLGDTDLPPGCRSSLVIANWAHSVFSLPLHKRMADEREQGDSLYFSRDLRIHRRIASLFLEHRHRDPRACDVIVEYLRLNEADDIGVDWSIQDTVDFDVDRLVRSTEVERVFNYVVRGIGELKCMVFIDRVIKAVGTDLDLMSIDVSDFRWPYSNDRLHVRKFEPMTLPFRLEAITERKQGFEVSEIIDDAAAWMFFEGETHFAIRRMVKDAHRDLGSIADHVPIAGAEDKWAAARLLRCYEDAEWRNTPLGMLGIEPGKGGIAFVTPGKGKELSAVADEYRIGVVPETGSDMVRRHLGAIVRRGGTSFLMNASSFVGEEIMDCCADTAMMGGWTFLVDDGPAADEAKAAILGAAYAAEFLEHARLVDLRPQPTPLGKPATSAVFEGDLVASDIRRQQVPSPK